MVKVIHWITVTCGSDATVAEYSLLPIINLDLSMADNRLILVLLVLTLIDLHWIITFGGVIVSSLSQFKLLASNNCCHEALLDVI